MIMKVNALSDTLATEQPTHSRHFLAIILCITILIAYFDRINVSIMIADPAFIADMGIANNPLAKGLMMSAFMVSYGISNILLGSVGDRLGPRKTMLLSIIIWAIACAIGGLAAGVAVFLVARILLGVGEGLHFPMNSVFIKNWFPNEERGKANSTWMVGVNLAPVIGMPLFSVVVMYLGWRGTMFGLTALSLVPFLLLWFFTADHPHLNKRTNQAEQDYIANALKTEHDAESRVVKTGVWKNAKLLMSSLNFWILVLYYCGANSVTWGVLAWLPSYLREARGFSWGEMGVLASLPFVVKILVTIYIGHASDKTGRRAPFMAIAGIGTAIFISLAAYIPSNIASVFMISAGVGFISLGTPPFWALVQRMLPANTIGAGVGMANGISLAVAAASPIAIGVLIGLTGSYVGGLMYLVGFAAVSGVMGMILTFKKL